MHWYNPKTRSVEDTTAPGTDEEALKMLRGHANSGAFMWEYERLREEEGMPPEQAMLFVGHHFRLKHLEFRAAG